MNTKAFSPGLAWMSSNSFSSSYRVSPSAGSGTCTVLGMWFSLSLSWLQNVWPGLHGRAQGPAGAWRPALAVAARHGVEDERTEAPRQPPVDRCEQIEEEAALEALPRSRTRVSVAGCDVALRSDQQVVLGVLAEPAGEPHHRHALARRFCAASAMGSFSAPIGGEYTFSM